MAILRLFGLYFMMTFLMVIVGLVVGAYFGGDPFSGMFVFLFIALAINIFSYFYSDTLVLKAYGARIIERQDSPRLYGMVKNIANINELPMPRIAIVESSTPNAFATGRNPKNAVVAATTGLMSILDDNELEGVMAHEMAHVGNRDTLIMAMVATIAGAISMLAMFAQISAMFGGMSGRRGGGGNIIGLLLVAFVMPLAAGVVRAAISRTREYQADATGALTSGDPLALASALQKLELASQRRPMKVAEGASHLFIVNPLRGASMSKMFSTHPPMAERIKRLQDIRPDF